jgi:hypothetical protein
MLALALAQPYLCRPADALKADWDRVARLIPR